MLCSKNLKSFLLKNLRERYDPVYRTESTEVDSEVDMYKWCPRAYLLFSNLPFEKDEEEGGLTDVEILKGMVDERERFQRDFERLRVNNIRRHSNTNPGAEDSKDTEEGGFLCDGNEHCIPTSASTDADVTIDDTGLPPLQPHIDGDANIWIVKPGIPQLSRLCKLNLKVDVLIGTLGRGTGIKVFNSTTELLNYVDGIEDDGSSIDCMIELVI